MEELGGARFDGLASGTRKKRSQTSRRPRPDSQPVSDGPSPLSSTPSDDASKASSDENSGCDLNPKRKEFILNQYVSGMPSDAATEDGEFSLFLNNEPGHVSYNKRSSEGVLAPANWKGSSKSKDSLENDNRVKKVKLKVGGVSRMIQAKSAPNGSSSSGTTAKSSQFSDASRPRQKQRVFTLGNYYSLCHHYYPNLLSAFLPYRTSQWGYLN